MNEPRARSPHGLPILTEVVLVPERDTVSVRARTDMSESRLENFAREPAVTPLQADVLMAITDKQELIIRRVLNDLEQQLDSMFEIRLRQVLEPALARIADILVEETRTELVLSLRETVAKAVAIELAQEQHNNDIAHEASPG